MPRAGRHRRSLPSSEGARTFPERCIPTTSVAPNQDEAEHSPRGRFSPGCFCFGLTVNFQVAYADCLTCGVGNLGHFGVRVACRLASVTAQEEEFRPCQPSQGLSPAEDAKAKEKVA